MSIHQGVSTSAMTSSLLLLLVQRAKAEDWKPVQMILITQIKG